MNRLDAAAIADDGGRERAERVFWICAPCCVGEWERSAMVMVRLVIALDGRSSARLPVCGGHDSAQ